jgi:hypothetical protein
MTNMVESVKLVRNSVELGEHNTVYQRPQIVMHGLHLQKCKSQSND